MAKVLIIDDSRSVSTSMSFRLWNEGHEVQTAASGHEGVSLARRENPDLIILDYELPDMTGRDVWDALRTEEVDSPVIMVTGTGSEELAASVMREGVKDYLVKKDHYLDRLSPVVDRVLKEEKLRRALAEKEAALRSREETTRVLLNACYDAALLVETDGRILAMNRAASRLFEVSPGQNARGKVPGFGFDSTEIPVSEAMESEQPICFAGRWADRRFEITIWPMADSVQAVRRVAVYCREMTAYLSLQEALAEANENLEQRIAARTAELAEVNRALQEQIDERKRVEDERAKLAAAVERADEVILIIDDQWTVEYVNPAFTRMTGHDRKDAVGTDYWRLCLGDHPEVEAVRTAVGRDGVWRGKLVRRDERGSVHDVETTISRITDDQGKTTHHIVIQRDVTQVRDLERRLSQSHKLEAMGTLAAGIAHDFNNILGAIVGYTELAMADVETQSRAARYLTQVLTAGQRAADLVRQILVFCRQSDDQLVPTSWGPIVKEALQLLRASLPSTIEFRSHVDTDVAQVLTSPTQVHQMVMNLCTNAAKALPETGGTLEVRLTDVSLEPGQEDAPLDLSPGDYVLLSVADNGRGMDRALMDRIFEPYFTTKKEGEGTGMGLALVHGIVKRCGGAITVDSQPGLGSVFRIYVPRLPGRTKSQDDTPKDLPRGHARILLVDDEPPPGRLDQKSPGASGVQGRRPDRFPGGLADFPVLGRALRPGHQRPDHAPDDRSGPGPADPRGRFRLPDPAVVRFRAG
jgi:PAS domain S-box-containing protein